MRVRDEVCGMEFEAEKAVATRRVGGKTLLFCSERCRRLFEEHPGWYVPVAPGAEGRRLRGGGEELNVGPEA